MLILLSPRAVQLSFFRKFNQVPYSLITEIEWETVLHLWRTAWMSLFQFKKHYNANKHQSGERRGKFLQFMSAILAILPTWNFKQTNTVFVTFLLAAETPHSLRSNIAGIRKNTKNNRSNWCAAIAGWQGVWQIQSKHTIWERLEVLYVIRKTKMCTPYWPYQILHPTISFLGSQVAINVMVAAVDLYTDLQCKL
jgi:hypothetical protein